MAEACSSRWPLHLFFAIRCLGRYTLTTLTSFECVILTNSGYSHDESMQQKDWRIYTCANTSCNVEICTSLAEANRRGIGREESKPL